MKIVLSFTWVVFAFVILTSCGDPEKVYSINKYQKGGLYEISTVGTTLAMHNSTQTFTVNPSTFLPFSEFEEMREGKLDIPGAYALNFRLTSGGAEKLKAMTERNLNKQICFVVNDSVIAAPIIQSAIPNGLVSLTMPDRKALDRIIDYLKSK